MILLRILLFPFSWLYYLITQIRNRLYDLGFTASVKFDLPVICVGNLTVGGTGKTPMIEHLIRMLQNNYKVATLSRGYARRTKGIRIAGPSDNALTLGDEPFQFYAKFGKRITVAVGEERALAIPTILQERPETQVILLDDGFQHRKVTPGFSILLTDYFRPFYKDFLLPSGRLRESKGSANRADVIVVTKCPYEISEDEMIYIEKSIRDYAEKPVFFTNIRYGHPTPFLNTSGSPSQEVVLITGIGNSKPLVTFVKQNYTLVKHIAFNDHHTYTEHDIASLIALRNANANLSFITTEKDKVKIDIPQFQNLTKELLMFYIPIEVDFIKGGKDFDEIVLNMVKRGL
ncbi:tetraacyldisaccharide 4'-kinase [Chryseolinea sp. H1M3-3]|uniref:tetraacyldisaccharide 4'-kinase n=1 Tax=Chryseolinea sp. H1M3-3 TaxID=3034144 RepID=UPI0023EB6BA4|nr:tetraacyldisaccharide 4'-kinase [Chryseolinea sp. H1M3-3]